MESETPQVSVVMSVYNEPAEWLSRSVDSILHQTFADFEFLIIVDNPDNTEANEILYDYKKNDGRIVVIVNEANIGLTKALNKGLAIAKGKYIVRIDADDIAMPNRLAIQVAYMEAHPDVAASGSQAVAIDENEKKHGIIKAPIDATMIKAGSLFASPLLHPTVIIRNFEGLRYDETYRYSQDYELWVRMMSEGRKVVNIDKTLMMYRYSSNQIFRKHKEEQKECADRVKINALKMLKMSVSIENMNIIGAMINKDVSFRLGSEETISAIKEFHDSNSEADKEEMAFVCYKLLQNALYVLKSNESGLKLIPAFWKTLKATGSHAPKRFAVIAYYALM